MSEYNIDIADMQCWVFRMAQTKWNMSPGDCAALFKLNCSRNTTSLDLSLIATTFFI